MNNLKAKGKARWRDEEVNEIEDLCVCLYTYNLGTIRASTIRFADFVYLNYSYANDF